MAGRGSGKTHITAMVFGLIALIFIVLCGSFLLIWQSVGLGITSAEEAYSTALAEETEKTAEEYYKWAFNKAEGKYHTSNEVTITIGTIREQAKLEVLKVSNVEFITENADENKEDITAWIAVPGEGVFTVDMTMSEFIIDNVRHVIVARVPQPQLTECRVDSGNIDIYKFSKDSIANGTYSEGTTLAEEHLQEGADMIRKEFLSNQQYFLSAQRSAEVLITGLIRNLNSGIEDLKVEIEFVD